MLNTVGPRNAALFVYARKAGEQHPAFTQRTYLPNVSAREESQTIHRYLDIESVDVQDSFGTVIVNIGRCTTIS